MRQEAFSSYLWQGITWCIQLTNFLGSPSGNLGLPGLHRRGRYPPGTTTGTQPCLPHCQPQGTALTLLHLLPPSIPGAEGARCSVQTVPQTTQCTAIYGNKMSPGPLFPFPLKETLPCHKFNVGIFSKDIYHEEHIRWRNNEGVLDGKRKGLSLRVLATPRNWRQTLCTSKCVQFF